MKGRRGEGEDINGLRRAGAAPPRPPRARDEALIAIAAGIESGVLSALPSNRDLQRSALGAGGKSLQMTRRGGA
jgi:hypothetical protein